jgi:hypothetical protein
VCVYVRFFCFALFVGLFFSPQAFGLFESMFCFVGMLLLLICCSYAVCARRRVLQ